MSARNAETEAAKLGIRGFGKSMSYAATGQGQQAAYDTLSSGVSSFRAQSGTQTMNLDPDKEAKSLGL